MPAWSVIVEKVVASFVWARWMPGWLPEQRPVQLARRTPPVRQPQRQGPSPAR